MHFQYEFTHFKMFITFSLFFLLNTHFCFLLFFLFTSYVHRFLIAKYVVKKYLFPINFYCSFVIRYFKVPHLVQLYKENWYLLCYKLRYKILF